MFLSNFFSNEKRNWWTKSTSSVIYEVTLTVITFMALYLALFFLTVTVKSLCSTQNQIQLNTFISLLSQYKLGQKSEPLASLDKALRRVRGTSDNSIQREQDHILTGRNSGVFKNFRCNYCAQNAQCLFLVCQLFLGIVLLSPQLTEM